MAKSVSIATIRGGDEGYVAYHAPRYAFLLDLLARYGLKPDSRLLDIGPSRLTALIREQLGARVDSLGFGEDREENEARHFAFDLNLAQRREDWRTDLPRYDFIVMAEVLEHLYTAPHRFFRGLVACSSTNGSTLAIVSAPVILPDLFIRSSAIPATGPFETWETL